MEILLESVRLAMNVAPANPTFFWMAYALGTLGPVVGSLLLNHHRPFDDRDFVLSWLLWLIGAGLLSACVWSVRSILFLSAKARRPVWAYRFVAWLAVVECFLWAYTVLRTI